MQDMSKKIEARAYELYLKRHSDSGSALDDWLTAEEEISSELDTKKVKIKKSVKSKSTVTKSKTVKNKITKPKTIKAKIAKPKAVKKNSKITTSKIAQKIATPLQ